jgi:glutamate/tyrosine decarboxylase-like PLP-dependent enzyme
MAKMPVAMSALRRTMGARHSPSLAEDLGSLLGATSSLIEQMLDWEQHLPAAELRKPEALRALAAIGPQGRSAAEVLERLGEVMRATPSTSSPRFLNQLFGGREPLATVAEMLTAVTNVSMYTFKAAGAQVLVENEVLRRMLAASGMPAGEGTFTPGGSIANLVALVLARNAAAPTARDYGLGGRRLAIYTSAEGHYSIPKAAGIVGIGRAQVRAIAVDGQGRMSVPALAARIEADLAAGVVPALINATAGTTVRGTFDPIRELRGLADQCGAWLHVDGALGGSLILSPLHRHLLDGVELADSFAWNPHKMMGVPLQASALLVARSGTLAASLDESADYLFQSDGEDLNPGHRSIQCGRRNDALKLWAAWQHLGDRGWAERLDRQMALAQHAADLIEADPQLELAERPVSINVNFEVRGCPSELVCERLDQRSRLKIGYGRVGERSTIRLVCVNPALQPRDLEWILDEIKAAAHS